MEFGINDWRNALLDTDLPMAAKLVGVAIAKYYRADKPCFPSLLTLMDECSIKSKHTVIKAIEDLKKAGVIKVKKKELRYVSSLQNYYEFVGVDDGANNSATNGAGNGATKGAINAPEIREEENKLNNIPPISPQKKNIKTLVKDDWQPSEATKAKLEAQGLDVGKVVDRFINSCQAKGLKYANFDRAILAWDWSRDKAVKKRDVMAEMEAVLGSDEDLHKEKEVVW